MKYPQLKSLAQEKWLIHKNNKNTRILVGAATCGVAVGAREVIATFKDELEKSNIEAEVLQVGCLGLCYAEPLVVISKGDNPSIVYKNISEEDVPRLVRQYLQEDDLCFDLVLGTLEGGVATPPYIPELERFDLEKRIILRYAGYIEPESIYSYIALGGYEGLSKAFNMRQEEVIREIKNSHLRGLGGAGFPTGVKMEASLKAPGKNRNVICNADEGDPGAFMDRIVLESCPHQVIEGMVISAYALRASKGYIYIRLEYPLAIHRFKVAIEQARNNVLLGKDILESGFDFDIEIIPGGGAFVCGESSALISSIEGKRPMPRVKPPRSAEFGLFGEPTLINNVKTFSCIPSIISNGAEWFSSMGTQNSKGTAVFSLAGKVANPGLVEVEMGTTLREVVYYLGGGVREGKRLKGVQIGGPSGGCIPSEYIDTPVDFDSLQVFGSMLGSGGLIVMDEETCMVDVAKYFLKFLKNESCGKCSFCRVGLSQMYYILEGISKGEATLDDLNVLNILADDIKDGSLCGLGKTAPNPVLTTLKYFRSEYEAHILEQRCPALVCRDLIFYYIIPEKCYRGCEHCVLKCPTKSIFTNDRGIKEINQTKCSKCGNCLEVCPEVYKAVKIFPKSELNKKLS